MSARKAFITLISVIGVLLMVLLPFYTLAANAQDDIAISKISARLSSEQPFVGIDTASPTIDKPKWYTNVTFYYTVSSNGSVSNLDTFATLANQTLNDSRGWSRLGVQFKQVASGGSLHLILSEASLLPTYSSGCTSDWSCTVGNSVIINDDRWTGASTAWNAAGGSLRDYRHMVVNHETGHWLGHGHEFCSASGALASVMQQQSIDLQGCKFNPWPLDSELWSSRL
jgi:hypothetical protein